MILSKVKVKYMKYSLQKIVRKYYPDIHILFWNTFIVTDALRLYLRLPQNIKLFRAACVGYWESTEDSYTRIEE